MGGITPKSMVKHSKSTPKATKTETKTPTSYYDEQTESEVTTVKPQQPKVIDPEVWRGARVKLKEYLENFG